MNITITLPWPDAKLSANNSSDHRSKIRAALAAKDYAYGLAREAMAGIWPKEPESVVIFIRYYPPNRRRADWDNVVSRCKNYQDGIIWGLGWDDDLITDAHVSKCPPEKPGRIEYQIDWNWKE